MRKGHVTGHKKERPSTNPNWYYQTEEAQELLRHLDAAWQAQQAAPQDDTTEAAA